MADLRGPLSAAPKTTSPPPPHSPKTQGADPMMSWSQPASRRRRPGGETDSTLGWPSLSLSLSLSLCLYFARLTRRRTKRRQQMKTAANGRRIFVCFRCCFFFCFFFGCPRRRRRRLFARCRVRSTSGSSSSSGRPFSFLFFLRRFARRQKKRKHLKKKRNKKKETVLVADVDDLILLSGWGVVGGVGGVEGCPNRIIEAHLKRRGDRLRRSTDNRTESAASPGGWWGEGAGPRRAPPNENGFIFERHL